MTHQEKIRAAKIRVDAIRKHAASLGYVLSLSFCPDPSTWVQWILMSADNSF